MTKWWLDYFSFCKKEFFGAQRYKRLHKMNFDHFNVQRVTRKERKDFHLQQTWKHFLNIRKHHQFDTLLKKKDSELWAFQLVGLFTFSLNVLIQNNMCGFSTVSQNFLRFPPSLKSPGKKFPPGAKHPLGLPRDLRGRPIRGFPPLPQKFSDFTPFWCRRYGLSNQPHSTHSIRGRG